MEKLQLTKFFIFLIALLNLISISAKAQYYSIRQYSTKEGLTQYQIKTLFIDKQHYIWVGTKGGISIFDGLNFINLKNTDELLGSEVENILEDDSAQVWVLTNKGLTKIIHFEAIKYDLGSKINSFSKFNHFYFDKKLKLFYIDVQLKNNKNDLFLWNKNKLWNVKDSVNLSQINDNKIDYLFYGNDIYICTQTKSKIQYRKLNYQEKKISKYGYSSLRLRIDSNRIAIDSLTNIYIIDPQKPKIIDKKPKSNNYFSENKSRFYNIINISNTYPKFNKIDNFNNFRIRKYKENIFIGDEYGLIQLGNKAFIHIKSKCLNNKLHNIWVVAELDKQFYFFSYRENSYIYKPEKKKLFRQKTKDAYYFGWNYIAKNKIIIGNQTGYSFVTPKGIKKIKDNLRAAISFIYKDKNNQDLYLCHTNGLSILHKNGQFTDYFNNKGSDLAYPLCITKDKFEQLWIVGNRRIRKLKNGQLSDIKGILNKTGAFTTITDDRKNLWFGTKDGLVFYNYKHYRKIEYPLLQTIVTGLFQVDKKRLLIGTSNGLAMLNLNLFYQKDSILIQWFNQNNDFATEECQQNSFFKDSKGFIWIPLINEVVKIDTAFLKFNTESPEVIIQYIQSNKNNKKYFPSSEKITLDKEDRNIQIHFTAIEYNNPKGIKFAYRLLGNTEQWSKKTNLRYFNISNLEAKKYNFQIVAFNENGVISQTSNLTFRIKKSWNEYNLSKILFFIFLITSITLIAKKNYQVIEKKKIKERLFKEKIEKLQSQNLIGLLDHHFLFNSINASAQLAFELQPKKLYESMAKLANLLRYILQRNEGINISLSEEINQIDNFIAIQKIRFKERLKYNKQIEAIDEIMDIQIPRLFIYHFIENAIKYSIEETENISKIKLSCYILDKNYCMIEIEDNGIGEKSKLMYKASTGIGIQSNKDLITILNHRKINLHKIKFKLIYKEAPQSGMIVKIWMPLNFDYYIGE